MVVCTVVIYPYIYHLVKLLNYWCILKTDFFKFVSVKNMIEGQIKNVTEEFVTYLKESNKDESEEMISDIGQSIIKMFFKAAKTPLKELEVSL